MPQTFCHVVGGQEVKTWRGAERGDWVSMEHQAFCVCQDFEVSCLHGAAAPAASSHFSLTWLWRLGGAVTHWLTGSERLFLSVSWATYRNAMILLFFFTLYRGEDSTFFFKSITWFCIHYIPQLGALKGPFTFHLDILNGCFDDSAVAVRFVCTTNNNNQSPVLRCVSIFLWFENSSLWTDTLPGFSCEQAQGVSDNRRPTRPPVFN